MSFLENNFFLLAVTFGVFFFAKLLQKKTGLVLLNPILLTIAVLIIFLKMPISLTRLTIREGISSNSGYARLW